jgi:ferredoxin-NADP reductase
MEMDKKRAFDTFHAVVDRIESLTPRNKGFHFKLPNGKTMPFKPGQFVQVFIPIENDKVRRTSYSIASPPRQLDGFELCVTLVDGGKSSGFLHSLQPGTTVDVMGPLGKFTLPDPITRDIVFIATGSGIAPFRSMIGNLMDRKTNRNLYLIFGNRFDGDIIYKDELEELSKTHPNFKVLFTLSKPTAAWKGKKGYVQEQVADFIPEPAKKDFYICGLSKMISDVEAKLISLGVPKEQIHFERYD